MNQKAFNQIGICAIALVGLVGRIIHADTASLKRFNVYGDPIGLIQAGPVVGADFRLGDYLTLGPTAGIMIPIKDHTNNFEASSYTLGVRANIFFTGSALNHRSWYLAPEIDYINIQIKDTDDGSKVDVPIAAISLIAGYHWFWDCGFNLGVGGGARYIGLPSHVTYKSGPKEGVSEDVGKVRGIVPTLELLLGWAF